MGITHSFTSTKADGGDSTLVKPSDWNASHVLTGAISSTDYDVSPNPTAYDDEFKSTSMASWTTLGTPDTSNSNTDLLSNLHMTKTGTGAFQVHGIYKAIPSMPFTVTLALTDFKNDANYQQYALMLGEASPGKLMVYGPAYQSANGIPELIYYLWTNRTTRTGTGTEYHPIYNQPIRYIRMVVTSSTSVDIAWSRDGQVFYTLATAINPGFTIGTVGIGMTGNDNSVNTDLYADWIRFGTSVIQPSNLLVQNVGGINLTPSMVLLEQHTAASSATLDFTSFISSDYDEYQIEISGIVPASNGVNFLMRCGTGAGPTWDTGANYGWSTYDTRAGGSGAQGAEGGATASELNYPSNVGNAANWTVNGSFKLFNPSGSAYKIATGNLFYYSGTYREQAVVTATYESTTAVTGIRFLMSSGNITSGTIRIYGIPKTLGAGVTTNNVLSGMILLEQHTAASVATLDFTTSLSGSYDDYAIELVGLVSATNSVDLTVNCSTDGGSSWDTTSGHYMWTQWGWQTAGTGQTGSASDTTIHLTYNGANTASNGIYGSLKFMAVGGSLYPTLTGQVSYLRQVNSLPESLSLLGQFLQTTAVNALRFQFSSGNIASGTIRIYGIPKDTVIGSVTDYVSGVTGTGHITIPGLSGNPDRLPALPSAYNDEFTSLTGWTTLGSPDTLNVTDSPSLLHMGNTSIGYAMNGIYKTAPSMPFTVITKVAGLAGYSSYVGVHLIVTEASPGKIYAFGPLWGGYSTGTFDDWWASRWTTRTSRDAGSNTQITTTRAPFYMRMKVNSSTSVDCAYSWDGFAWYPVYTGVNTGLTVANVGLAVAGNTGGTLIDVWFDWIRFT